MQAPLTKFRIPVYRPKIEEEEKKYVNQCLDSSWISSKGQFIERFENFFSSYLQVAHVSSVCNGTVALDLALRALGVQQDDEIIVPTLTYVASVNAIVHLKAKPIFVDSLISSWQMDPKDIEKKITRRTRAIMAVHLYGHPCDMKSILKICQDYQLLLVEDCAEAFGSYYCGKHVGGFGDIATFSFFGNKTITTGEGGMVVSKSSSVHDLVCRLKNQGVSKEKQYWHDLPAFNYRMTNICAAIGVAQLEKADAILAKKRQIAVWYRECLSGLPLKAHDEVGDVVHSYWMCSILLNDENNRDPLRAYLEAMGVETRPLFYPVHQMPVYHSHGSFPNANYLSTRGINLPSYPALTKDDVEEVSQKIREYFGK